MKKGVLFLAFLFLIIIVAVLTNPKIDIHKEAVSEKINERVFNNEKDNNVLVEVVGKNLTDLILNKAITIENYVLFSVTKLKRKGEKKTIGIGAFGNVFLNSEFEESIKDLNSKSESKTTQSEPEIKILDKQSIAEEPKPTLVKEEKTISKKTISSSDVTENSEDLPEKQLKKTADTNKSRPVRASSKKAFGGNSNKEINGDGIGTAFGGAGSGPGSFGKLGKEEGYPPEITNPTSESGKVVIELTVDQAGRIIDVKVLATHPKTTTIDPVLLNQAKKDGYKFKFKADSKRAELSKSLKIINYILK